MKRFFNLFSKENSIRGASLILIITLTLSNILGLLRDRFLTKNISTYHLDIYYAAFRIPDAIFNTLILGAITSAFIPLFSDFLANRKEKEGYKMASNLINISLIIVAVVAALLVLFMPALAPLVVHGFDSYRMNEVVRYSRLLMLLPFFFAVSYIIGGILNSRKRFFAYSLAPLVYNLSIILGAAFLAPRYGLIGVVYSVIAGSFFHLLIQLIPAIRLGFRYSFRTSFSDGSIKRIGRLTLPRSISMGSGQLMFLVFNRIASSLAAGSISAFNLANNIQTVPSVILGSSFATAIFPTLARQISENKNEEFAFYLNRALRAIGYLLIPSTVIFILLRAQIVRLILGSGKFSWDDTRATALALGFFSISILAQGVIPLLSRAFYALKNTRTPMTIAIFSVVVSIALAYPLSQRFGVSGLALAYSVGSYFNAFLLTFFLKQRYPKLLNKELFISYLKTAIISLVMAVFVWYSMHLTANYVDMSRFFGVLLQASVASVIGIIVFLALGRIFDQEEMGWVITRRIADGK